MSTTPYMLAYAIHRAQQAEVLRNGIIAMVGAYYENFTDAVELEAGFVATLTQLMEFIDVPELDLCQMIAYAEMQINKAGGIMSDTDNVKHRVRTGWAWEQAVNGD